MDQGLIPNRYAKALYKFALDKGEASRVYELMKNVAASFAGQPPLGDLGRNIGPRKKLVEQIAHQHGFGASHDSMSPPSTVKSEYRSPARPRMVSSRTLLQSVIHI